jgi:hypothetical protein
MYRISVEIITQNDENKYEQFAFKDIKLAMYMVEQYAARKCLVQIEWIDAE